MLAQSDTRLLSGVTAAGGGGWCWDIPESLCESGKWVSLKNRSRGYRKTRLLKDRQTPPPTPPLPTTQEEPQHQSISSLGANKPPTAREAQVRVSSAGVVQPDIGRETEQKRNGLGGNWGYGMRRASGEEFRKALVRREAHTAGEFLMSEDLTGDSEQGKRGRYRTDTQRRENRSGRISPCSVSMCGHDVKD